MFDSINFVCFLSVIIKASHCFLKAGEESKLCPPRQKKNCTKFVHWMAKTVYKRKVHTTFESSQLLIVNRISNESKVF